MRIPSGNKIPRSLSARDPALYQILSTYEFLEFPTSKANGTNRLTPVLWPDMSRCSAKARHMLSRKSHSRAECGPIAVSQESAKGHMPG